MRSVLCALLLILLSACDKPQAPKPAAKTEVKPAPVQAVATPATPALPPLSIKTEHWKKTKPQCQGEACPYIEVELVQFGDKELAALVEKTLAGMVSIDEKQPAFSNISELSKFFWPKTEDHWNIYLHSKVLRQYKNLLVMQLDSDTYSGGAHGIAATRYLNINRENQQVLTLADVLEPGKDAEFWQKVQGLHLEWQKANGLTDPDLNKTWPFIKTDNFALTEQGLTVKYQSYDIAAYAFGQPEFTVPYTQLNGIVKPAFL